MTTSTLLAALAEQLDPQDTQIPGPTLQTKQQIATDLADQVDELLYGGAAGGGKSVWLRHYIIRYALKNPNSYIGLLRRDLPKLKRTHARQLTALLHHIAKLNRSDWTWTFANGSVIQFVGLQHEGDELAYNSAEFDLLAWDELTEFTFEQYTYMLSRLRSSSGQHRSHSIAATNPLGTGYQWVKRYWIKPRKGDLLETQKAPDPYEIWAQQLPDNSGMGPTRAYVPATVYDNDALIQSQPSYLIRLKSNPDPRKRKALLDGDWNAMSQVEGALFNLDNIEEYRRADHPDLIRTAVAFDPAVSFTDKSDETGIVGGGKGPDKHIYVLGDYSGHFNSPEAACDAVVNLAKLIDADVVIYEKNQGDAYVKSMINAAFNKAIKNKTWTGRPLPIQAVHARRGKALRAQPVAQLYSQGLVHHVGEHAELEEQLTTWTPEEPKSPDRLDANVYLVTHLDGRSNNAARAPQAAW